MRTREYSHPALTEFAAIAGGFCDTVANLDQRTPEAQLDEIHRLLPQIYSAALRLPDTSVLFDARDDLPNGEPDAAPLAITSPPGLTQLADSIL